MNAPVCPSWFRTTGSVDLVLVVSPRFMSRWLESSARSSLFHTPLFFFNHPCVPSFRSKSSQKAIASSSSLWTIWLEVSGLFGCVRACVWSKCKAQAVVPPEDLSYSRRRRWRLCVLLLASCSADGSSKLQDTQSCHCVRNFQNCQYTHSHYARKGICTCACVCVCWVLGGCACVCVCLWDLLALVCGHSRAVGGMVVSVFTVCRNINVQRVTI